METPSINEILQNIQYRFKENLESNLTTIPTSQAALIIFATKVLTETVTEVAFDTLQHMMSNKPFPFEVPEPYNSNAIVNKVQQAVTEAMAVPTPSPKEHILFPWSVVNLGHILHAYEVYPAMQVTMHTYDAATNLWNAYYHTVSREAFQNFCNSMSKEDPTARYKISTSPYIQLVP